jgi:hypothetical protein
MKTKEIVVEAIAAVGLALSMWVMINIMAIIGN